MKPEQELKKIISKIVKDEIDNEIVNQLLDVKGMEEAKQKNQFEKKMKYLTKEWVIK